MFSINVHSNIEMRILLGKCFSEVAGGIQVDPLLCTNRIEVDCSKYFE